MSKQKIILRSVFVVILVVVAAVLVYWVYYSPIQSAANQGTTVNRFPSASTTTSTSTSPAVADNEPNIGFVPSYHEDRVPISQIANYQAIKAKYGLTLSAAQEKFLDDNRFILLDASQTTFFIPSENFDRWLFDADTIGGGAIAVRKPEDTVLVTPDLVLHAYHKYFELTLKKLEQNELSQALGNFLSGLYNNLSVAVRQSSGQAQVRYQNLEAQIVLARVLFENKNVAKPNYFASPDDEQKYNDQDKNIDSLANAEKILTKYSKDLTPALVADIKVDLAGIYAANAIGQSPLFKQYDDQIMTDYTQYTPRSHYTENSALRAYFRTMMYLGRSSYLLKSDLGIADTNLLVKQMAVKNKSGVAPLDQWKKITAVTNFYAGQSDDLSYNEWQDFTTRILGANQTSDEALIAPDNIKKLAQNLNQIRLPKILSDVIIDENIASLTKSDLLRQSLSFRVFGQKFTYDAWILNDLTAGQEKTDPKLPSTPSALFIPAAIGDGQARNYVSEFLSQTAGFSPDEIKGFLTKLDQKKADIAKVKDADWLNSLGSAWFYVLGSLTHNYGAHYPLYMQATSFLDKQIQSFLGSYAELKHDTLLYAKQSYAEMGGGPGDQPIPPVVKGFVEPNLEFWTRFNSLISRTEQLFQDNNLFVGDSAADRLQQFKTISSFYAKLAEQELRGQTISDDDYETLRTTKLSFMAQPFDTALSPDETSSQTALIADIHTDMVKNQILYEATAQPYLMLAIVGNDNAPRVVAGLVYNHYELTDKIGSRLTDEQWRAKVYPDGSGLPAKNFWYQSLLIK
jgi:hypothetical protein